MASSRHGLVHRQSVDHLIRDQSQDSSQLPLKCMFCCKENRLQSFYEVSRGDHIKQPGENLSHNREKKLIRFYDHHAIIKEVHEVINDGSSAILTLIEFMTSPFDPTPKVREQTVLKNLYYDEISLIKYRHKTHPPDEIIKRGQQLMTKDMSYNLLYRNCEHVARWCVCGNDTSFQAEGAIEHTLMFFKFLRNYVLKIATLTIDDFLLIEKLGEIGGVSDAGPIVLVAVILLQLNNARNDTKALNKLLETDDICGSCCKRRKREIWAKFAALLTLQTGGIVATGFIKCIPLQIIFGVLVSILTVTVMSKVPKLIRKVCSPFVGRKVCIDSFHKIWIGDVVSKKVGGFYHDAVVTGVDVIPRSRKKKANVRIVHYSTPGLFTKGKVVEETIRMNLEHEELRLHDYTGYDYNEPEIVVERAQKRVGETKFGLTNRSAHFCHWAKLRDNKDFETNTDDIQHSKLVYLRPFNPDLDDMKLHSLIVNHSRTKPLLDISLMRDIRVPRPSTSKEIEKVKANIRDDIEPGQLIQFTVGIFPHQAVCTAVQHGSKPSIVNLTVVHYAKTRKVAEEMIEFDLNKVDVTIVKGHPLYKFNKRDIIHRAKARVGESGFNLFNHRSRHLAEEIVYKDIDRRIMSFSEVKPGDCIGYMYWKLPHDAVVIDVKPGHAKGNSNGKLTVVHYALDSLFGTRYIKKETLSLDLLKDTVVLKSFPGCIVYPDQVVIQRALSRVDERKFHVMGNISSDLVQWAKVVQTPCIVTNTTINDNGNAKANGSSENGERKPERPSSGTQPRQYLLLPMVGKPYEKYFQKDWIKTWDELIPGTIVMKELTVGILSNVQRSTNELKIIQNKTIDNELDMHIGMVTEVSMKIDVLQEYIYVFRCDPRYGNTPGVTMRKARQLLGTKVPGMGEWGFCKDCVVKY